MIKIVIAEDQRMVLGALGSLLNLEDDMEVIGKASNGKEAISLVKTLKPDVCIMDIEMPEKSGLEAPEELRDTGRSYYSDNLREVRLFPAGPKGWGKRVPIKRQPK